ncbi:membrane dipeptidase [Aneurinibacillus migulanus]|uniref:membrane dipeptidase n=1 Tax=Aneurinibacillus migulanus TaxID=47500 RepID=UPI0020A17CCC|nr:dipeptidase [Aneurinibacillus migulanus]
MKIYVLKVGVFTKILMYNRQKIRLGKILVTESDEKPNLEHLINHLDHMVKVVGVNHVGIGLDLCDMLLKYIPSGDFGKFERNSFDVVKGHQKS